MISENHFVTSENISLISNIRISDIKNEISENWIPYIINSIFLCQKLERVMSLIELMISEIELEMSEIIPISDIRKSN